MTDEVDITAKDLPPVEPRKADRPADSLVPLSEPSLPPVETAPVRARSALLLSETADQLASVPDMPAVAATQTLDDEAEALEALVASPAPAALKELPTAPPAGRPVRKKTHALPTQSDGFEGPSLEHLTRVEPPRPETAVSSGIHWSPVDWVVAALVVLMVLSVVLVFCAV